MNTALGAIRDAPPNSPTTAANVGRRIGLVLAGGTVEVIALEGSVSPSPAATPRVNPSTSPISPSGTRSPPRQRSPPWSNPTPPTSTSNTPSASTPTSKEQHHEYEGQHPPVRDRRDHLDPFRGRWGSVMIGDSLSPIITERNQGADAARTLAAALNALADNLQHGDDPAPTRPARSPPTRSLYPSRRPGHRHEDRRRRT